MNCLTSPEKFFGSNFKYEVDGAAPFAAEITFEFTTFGSFD